jgi:hypothetical protein
MDVSMHLPSSEVLAVDVAQSATFESLPGLRSAYLRLPAKIFLARFSGALDPLFASFRFEDGEKTGTSFAIFYGHSHRQKFSYSIQIVSSHDDIPF